MENTNQNPSQDPNQEHNNENIPQKVEEIESLNDNEELDPEDLEDVAGGLCFIRGCNCKGRRK